MPMIRAARARLDSFVSCQPWGKASASTRPRAILIASGIAESLAVFADFMGATPCMLVGMTKTRRSTTHGLVPVAQVLRAVAAKLSAQRDSIEKKTTAPRTSAPPLKAGAVAECPTGRNARALRAATGNEAVTDGRGTEEAAERPWGERPASAACGRGRVSASGRNSSTIGIHDIAKAASSPRSGRRSVGEQAIAPAHACSPFVSSNRASTASATAFILGSTSSQKGARFIACKIVVWSRPPNILPICGSE